MIATFRTFFELLTKPKVESPMVWGIVYGFLFVVIANHTIWWIVNQALPFADTADFIVVGIKGYHAIQEKGFLKGFLEAFMIRDSTRAYISSVFTLPFFMIFRGVQEPAIAATQGFFVCVLWIYSFLTLRHYKVFPIFAAVGATFMAFSSYVQAMSQQFFSEGGMLTAIAASVYHAHRMDLWRNRGHSIAFGLIFGMLLCFRFWTIVGPVFISAFILILIAIKQKEITVRELIATCLLLIMGAGLLSLSVQHAITIRTGMLATVFGALGFLLISRLPKNKLHTNFSLSIAAFITVLGLWWVPSFEHVYHQLKVVAFHPCTADACNGRYLANFSDALGFFMDTSGRAHIMVAIALALAGLIFLPFSKEVLFRSNIPIFLSGCAFYALPFAIAIWSDNGDPRRVWGGVYLLSLWALVVSLQPAIKFFALRGIGLTFYVLLLTAYLLSVSGHLQKPVVHWPFANIYARPPLKEFPDRQVYKKMREHVPNGKSVGLLTVSTYDYSKRIFERGTFHILSAMENSKLYFDTLGGGTGAGEFKRFHYLLVDTYSNEKVNNVHVLTRLAHKVAEELEAGKMVKNFELVEKFNISGRDIYLLRNTLKGN